MDASATFRLPAMAVSTDDTKTTATDRQRSAETEPSDERLLAQISLGSSEALSILFRRYARLVHTVANRVLHAPPEADDLVQEVFLLICRYCKTFDSSKGPARFWILQMASRRAISRRRYLTSRHFYTGLDIDDAAGRPRRFASSSSHRLRTRLREGWEAEAFRRCLKHCRRISVRPCGCTLWRATRSMKLPAKLGQSRGNVKHHYFRGLERLRKEIFGGKLPGQRAI